MPPARLAPDAAAFYAGQSAFTDPGALAPLYADLPDDPAQLARTARDLVFHRLEGEPLRHAVPRDRLHHDAETRYVDDILRLITERNDAPLTRRRAFGDRFVGVCRDLALLHCSFLRHAGIPARLRSGFADYFGPGFHSDHAVTEYWDSERGWLLADPQMTDPAVAGLWKIDFDPMDVPRDRFLVAGKAWQAIRTGEADPETFGLHPPADGPMFGEWFVAHDIRIDLAALNKVETLLWDTWGTGAGGGREMDDTARELYDRAALVASDDVPFAAALQLFAENEQLRTPKTVLSLAPFNGPTEATLR
ncbi:transglutaminase domain-containing protein [Streptomyces sp. NPDC088124]|uniref:transglutaminase-like domain-containing protein n=1 Tax=Streptomyces sp. NPDC088124 TaxID=3154654 RepID=UPI003428A4D7